MFVGHFDLDAMKCYLDRQPPTGRKKERGGERANEMLECERSIFNICTLPPTKVDGNVWVAENLFELKFRNGHWIHPKKRKTFSCTRIHFHLVQFLSIKTCLENVLLLKCAIWNVIYNLVSFEVEAHLRQGRMHSIQCCNFRF